MAGNGDTYPAERVFLGLRGLYSNVGDHIGHFYLEKSERTELVVPFLSAGIAEGDKCVFLVTPDTWSEIREGLERQGVDVAGALDSAQLVVETGEESADDQNNVLMEAITDTRKRFHLLRWVGDMTWTLGKMPCVEDLMEWETACNVVEAPPAVFLCQYDMKLFPGNVVSDALKTHPLCVIGDSVHRNPFYQDPEQYLAELQQRRNEAEAV